MSVEATPVGFHEPVSVMHVTDVNQQIGWDTAAQHEARKMAFYARPVIQELISHGVEVIYTHQAVKSSQIHARTLLRA